MGFDLDLNEFDQNSAHVLRMEEDDRHAVGADVRLASPKDGGALGPHLVAGGQDVRHLETDVVLAAARVLVQEVLNERVVATSLDQLDLRVGQIDEAD